MAGVEVEEFLRDQGAPLRLELVAGQAGLPARKIPVPDVHRPGLALANFFDHFPDERLQVVGRTELSYLLTLPAKRRREVLDRLFAYELCAVIVTQALRCPPDIVLRANEKKVPLLRSSLPTTKFISLATVYLEDKLAPMIGMHGTLVDVHGIGVLLLGPSGIGKSECALDLVDRGHRLVADDIVEIKRTPDGLLMGTGSPLIKHHMEIRGVGVINLQNVFGVSATRDRKLVEYVVQLEEWVEEKEYDRLGLDERNHRILDVPLPTITIPVRPGRPLAVIIEVAAMNERLKRMGTHAARDLNRKLADWMRGQREAG